MNPLKSSVSYFQGVQAEMRKVVWPTFPVLLQHFFSVLIGIALATAFVGIVDFLFLHALAYILTK